MLTRRVSAASPQTLNRELIPQTRDPCEFGLASLQGQYALIGTYGDHAAESFGERYFDGNGNLTGTFLINEPTPGSTTGEEHRNRHEKGTYTVNCNGTGVITRTLSSSTGVVTTQTDDLIITAAKYCPQGGDSFSSLPILPTHRKPPAPSSPVAPF